MKYCNGGYEVEELIIILKLWKADSRKFGDSKTVRKRI